MNGHGWKGVHAFNALASGEGPPTIDACITQEFQWSRSLMVLLLTELPKYWKRLPLKLRLQFLFAELWYPLFGLMFLLGTLLPVIAVILDQAWISVSFIDFLLYSTPVNLATLSVVWFLKRNLFLRPHNSPVMSWEIALFQLFRWPWALFGSFMGVVTVIRKKNTEFKVTPKGGNKDRSLNWKILLPYFIIVLVSAIPDILFRNTGNASGYHFFLLLNVIMNVFLILSIIILHRNETREQS
jgi:cellulose synthase (UDP-forming)